MTWQHLTDQVEPNVSVAAIRITYMRHFIFLLHWDDGICGDFSGPASMEYSCVVNRIKALVWNSLRNEILMFALYIFLKVTLQKLISFFTLKISRFLSIQVIVWDVKVTKYSRFKLTWPSRFRSTKISTVSHMQSTTETTSRDCPSLKFTLNVPRITKQ